MNRITSLGLTAAAAMTILALAGCATAQAEPKATSSHSEVKPTPKNTESVQQKAQQELEAQIASHEIKAGQSVQDTAKNAYGEVLSFNTSGDSTVVDDWNNYVIKHVDGSDAALQKFLDEYSAKQGKVYGPALFGPNYQTNATYINALAVNRAGLQNTIASAKQGTPFQFSGNFLSVESSSQQGDSLSISMKIQDTDNGGQGNTVPSHNGQEAIESWTFVPSGDILYIESITGAGQ